MYTVGSGIAIAPKIVQWPTTHFKSKNPEMQNLVIVVLKVSYSYVLGFFNPPNDKIDMIVVLHFARLIFVCIGVLQRSQS